MLDPIAAVASANPYPFYRALARERPIGRDERLDLWVAASADAVRAALSSPDLAVRPAGAQVPAALAGGPAGRLWASWARMNDGPRHAASRERVEALIGRVEGALGAAARQGAAEAGGELDRFVDHLPARALATALGVARPAAAAEAALALVRGGAATPAQGAHEAAAALLQLIPGPDEETRAAAVSLLFQASDATSGLLGNTLVHLARHPAQREAARADPSALDPVIAHVLATDPPVHNTRRFAVRDTALLGAEIASGATVLALLVSVPFGVGAHRCPADRLAAVIARAGAGAALGLDLPWSSMTAPRYRALPNVRIPRFDPGGAR